MNWKLARRMGLNRDELQEQTLLWTDLTNLELTAITGPLWLKLRH